MLLLCDNSAKSAAKSGSATGSDQTLQVQFVGGGHSDTQQVLEKASMQYLCCFTNTWVHSPDFTAVAQDR